MPPSSRRRKKYDQQLKTFQNRNVFAGVVLLLAAIGAIWLAVRLVPSNKPTVYLRTNYIDHSGSRKIPLAAESCELILDTFRDTMVDELLNWEDVNQLDQEQSTLNLPEEQITDKDVLVVYLNGHLVTQDSETEPVAFLAPEINARPQDLGNLLKQIRDTKASLKVVLLDAGRYSRSPVYPARELNEFNSTLAEALKQQTWGDLGDNLWIIVSHEDHEISRISTPLKSSLFAKAFAASIAELADNDEDKISMFDLFRQVREKTTSWSRNLKGHSTQHPVLMRSGVGIVAAGEDADVAWRVMFKPNEPIEEDKQETPNPSYEWSSFAGQQTGESAAESLFAANRYDALPFDMTQLLEGFLELGTSINVGRNAEVAKFNDRLKESRIPPKGNIRFDLTTLTNKQNEVLAFRKSVLGLSLLGRFQNELRHWEDDTLAQRLAPIEPPTVRVDRVADRKLSQANEAPSSYKLFTEQFDDFRRQHDGLVDFLNDRVQRARQQNADEALTPTQAEMLGRVSQRYLPLIDAMEPEPDADADNASAGSDRSDATNNSDAAPVNFRLNLSVVDNTKKFGTLSGVGMADLYNESTGAFNQILDTDSDTGFRFLLAAQGSENVEFRSGVMPNIQWEEIEQALKIAASSPSANIRVNPFDRDPILFNVTAKAIELVKLDVRYDAETRPASLRKMEYWFDETDFKSELAVQFPGGEAKTQSVRLVFENSNPRDWLGKEIPFLLKASSESVVEEFRFNVIFTADPTVEISAARKLATAGEERTWKSSEPMVRWGATSLPDRWSPLMLKSLANIESEFAFSIANNSSTAKTFSFRLYDVKQLPGNAIMRPDRTDLKTVTEMSRWLAERLKQPGENQLILPTENFTLLATAEPMVVPAGESKNLALAAPVGEGETGPSEESLELREVKNGMLLVASDPETKEPTWFQWLGFEPEQAADATASKVTSGAELLRPLPDILNEFQQNPDDAAETERTFKTLNELWPSPGIPAETPAARLTSVSLRKGSDSSYSKPLTLESVFQKQILPVDPIEGSEKRLLVMDLFEVPGYRIFSQNKDLISRNVSRDRLVGVRIRPNSLPPEWKCYPQSWSLIGFDGTTTATSAAEEIFLHMPASAEIRPQNVELDFQFMLPPRQGEILGNAQQDYKVRFNGGGKDWIFPNSRQHFVRTGQGGLSLLTKVTSHNFRNRASNFTDANRLEIVDKRTGEQIAAWMFRTRSTGKGLSVSLENPAVGIDNLADAKVKIDVSLARPPIATSDILISVGTQKLDDSVKFLERWQAGGSAPGKFEFPFSSLVSAMELELKPGPVRIEVLAKDFFGQTPKEFVDLVVKPRPKTVKTDKKKIAKRTNFIFLDITNADGKPAKVRSLERLTVNKAAVPLLPSDAIVAAAKSGSRVKVWGLRLGKHQVQVTVKVQSEKIANAWDERTATGLITITDDEQSISIQLNQ